MEKTLPTSDPPHWPNPRHICVATPVLCHPDWRGGGVARSSCDLSVALAQAGHRVTVVSPLVDTRKRFDEPEQKTFFDGRLEFRYVPEAKDGRLGTTHHGLEKVLRPALEGADVLHVHTFFSGWSDRACAIGRAMGKPYYMQPRGKLTPTMLANKRALKMAYLKLRGWKLLEDAAFVAPLTSVVGEAIREMNPKLRVEVITNGLHPEEFDREVPPRPIEEPYVLYIGYLDPRKNLDLLIRAFGEAVDRGGDWKLALVGSDNYGERPRLEGIVKELGLEDRVVMPGHVKGEPKYAWLMNAGFFAMPSSGEGLSLAMLEAFACRLPTLLAPGCNYPEVQVCGAGYELPLEVGPWAGALRELMGDPEKRAGMAKNARARFESDHTLRAVTDRIGGLLDGLLGG